MDDFDESPTGGDAMHEPSGDAVSGTGDDDFWGDEPLPSTTTWSPTFTSERSTVEVFVTVVDDVVTTLTV